MNDRLEKIFSIIPASDTFADVGCDHGYISYAMLKTDKCEKVYFSDVSEKCLEKAKALLKEYEEQGRATGILSDGLKKIPPCDTVLIAGMGGEEIIKILSSSEWKPDKLVLQPMKNCDRVRLYLVENGYKVDYDSMFFSKDKYYDLIVASVGKDGLSKDELDFGRGNINGNPIFSDYAKYRIEVLEKAITEDINEREKTRLKEYIGRLSKYVKT